MVRIDAAYRSALNYLRFKGVHPNTFESVQRDLDFELACFKKAWELWCSPEKPGRGAIRTELRSWAMEQFGVKRAFTFDCLNDWLLHEKLPASVQLRSLKPLTRPKNKIDFYYLMGAYAAHGSTDVRQRAISFWCPRKTPWLAKVASIIGQMTERAKDVQELSIGHKSGFQVRSQSSSLHYALAQPLRHPRGLIESHLKTPERRLAFLRGFFDVAIPATKTAAQRISVGGTNKRPTLQVVSKMLAEFGVTSRMYSYVVKTRQEARNTAGPNPQKPKLRYAQQLLIADPLEIQKFLNLDLLSDPKLKAQLKRTARDANSPHVRYSAELYNRVVSSYQALQTQHPDWHAGRITRAVRLSLGPDAPPAQLIGNWTRRQMSPIAAKRHAAVAEATVDLHTGAYAHLGLLPGSPTSLPMRIALDTLGSLAQLAPTLGCSGNHLLDVYLEKKPPSIQLRSQIMKRLGVSYDARDRLRDSMAMAEYYEKEGYPFPVRVLLGALSERHSDPEATLSQLTRRTVSELKDPRCFVTWDISQLLPNSQQRAFTREIKALPLLVTAARYLEAKDVGIAALAIKSTEYERCGKSDIERAQRILSELAGTPALTRTIATDKRSLCALDLLQSLHGFTAAERTTALVGCAEANLTFLPSKPTCTELSCRTTPWRINPADAATILALQGGSEYLFSFSASFKLRAEELAQRSFRSRGRAFDYLWEQVELWTRSIESRAQARPNGANHFWAYRG